MMRVRMRMRRAGLGMGVRMRVRMMASRVVGGIGRIGCMCR